jgi:phosphoglucomutase
MMAVAALALISSFASSTDAFVPRTATGTAFHRVSNSMLSATSAVTVTEVPTKPIPGMKPGTSGLRKKVEVWQAVDPANEHYVENFIQSLLDTATAKNDGKVPQT